MAQKRNGVQNQVSIAAEVVKVLADVATQDKVKEIAEKLAQFGGQAAHRLAAAARTNDPFDDLDAKLDAMAEFVSSKEGQRLSQQERDTVLEECQVFKRGIKMTKILRGREQKRKLAELRKQINLRFNALFELAILRSPGLPKTS